MPLRDFTCFHCGFMLKDMLCTKDGFVTLPVKCPNCKNAAAWKAEVSVPADPVVKGGTPKFHVGK